MLIAIIDDSDEERDTMALLMQDAFKQMHLTLCGIDFFKSAEEYLEQEHSKKYDLIILDIFMDHLTGMELAFKIREMDDEVRLVFCSSSNDFACESYSVNASYYIQKPATKEKILQMIKKMEISEYQSNIAITFPDQQKVIARNITYAEYCNHVISIYCKEGKGIRIRMAFNELVDLVKEYPFLICCNKGTLVNMYEIESIEKNALKTTQGDLIIISRRKINEVNELYQNFLFAMTRKELFK